MNIFSNFGITELVVILLLALLVVGPERLPELGRKLGQTLRDLRKAYDNLTRDLGPDLMSIQETTQELRDSFESVRSIPQDMVQSVVEMAELEDTFEELKETKDSIGQIGQTLSGAQKVIKDPLGAAISSAQNTLFPGPSGEEQAEEEAAKPKVGEDGAMEREVTPSAPEDEAIDEVAVLAANEDRWVEEEAKPVVEEGEELEEQAKPVTEEDELLETEATPKVEEDDVVEEEATLVAREDETVEGEAKSEREAAVHSAPAERIDE